MTRAEGIEVDVANRGNDAETGIVAARVGAEGFEELVVKNVGEFGSVGA